MKKYLIILLICLLPSLAFATVDTFDGQTGIDTWDGQTGVDTIDGQVISSGDAFGTCPASTTCYYVDTDKGADGDGTSWAQAYNDLQAAENAFDGDISASDPVIFFCKGSAADVATTFEGWTTDADSTVTIRGNNTSGIYNSSDYRLEGSDTNVLYIVAVNHITIDHVLVGPTVTANNSGIGINVMSQTATNSVQISNCIVKAISMAGNGAATGILINDSDMVVNIWNSISYGFVSGADAHFRGIRLATCTSTNIYNCTVYNNYSGFEQDAGTVKAYNSASFLSVGNDFDGTFDTVDYCGSDDNTGTNSQTLDNTDNYGTEFNDATIGDFSLIVGSICIGNGTDNPNASGLYTDDIKGSTRSTTWDIGAFEY